MEILIRSLEISLAICGLRIVSSKGMILYFLRMPYEWLQNELKVSKNYLKEVRGINTEDFKNKEPMTYTLDQIKYQKKCIKILNVKTYLLKPIIGCTTCMASVWTIVIEYSYFDLTKWSILTIFMVACLNSIFYALFEKLEK